MKALFVIIAFLLFAPAVAQQQDRPQRANGVIYGIAIGSDERPAKRVRLTTYLSGVALSARLIQTRTNDNGEFRFDNLPWWGKYAVNVEDEKAGYSIYSSSLSPLPEVEISPEHRETELNIKLPPRAGFVEIHLTNRKTDAVISAMRVAVIRSENPKLEAYSTGCSSDRAVLVPPDRDLLLHITSDGFREWSESFGNGKAIRLASGTRLILAVKLEPSD